MQQAQQFVIIDTNTKEFLTRRAGKFNDKLPKGRLFRFRNHAAYAMKKLTENHAAAIAGRALEIKPVQIVYSDSID